MQSRTLAIKSAFNTIRSAIRDFSWDQWMNVQHPVRFAGRAVIMGLLFVAGVFLSFGLFIWFGWIVIIGLWQWSLSALGIVVSVWLVWSVLPEK